MQSDATLSSSDSGNNPINLSDDQKLLGKPPLQSILKPPSASRPSRKNDTVIEMELAALAAVSALSVVSPGPEADRDDRSDIADKEAKGKKEKEENKSTQGSQEQPPVHLQPSLSPPPPPLTMPPSSPPPVTSPRRSSTPKRLMEQDDVGTLAFMAGRRFDDDDLEAGSMKPTEKKVAEKEQKSSQKVNSHATADSDPMDCSTLVAMAGINSVVEDYEPIKKVTVDQATSPTMPAHVMTNDASNMNMNNNTVTETTVIKEKASVDEGEAKKLKEQLHAQLLAQYHHMLREKRLKRTGSTGSIGSSRLSLPSTLSLIPESNKVVPASCGVTDKVSNEFALSTRKRAASSNVVGMSASAAGIVIVTEEPIKRVSFQDLSRSPAPAAAGNGAGESQHLIGRPLPARPLPPIGAPDANVFNEGNFPTVSPRAGNNRPLPPLNGMGMGNGNSVTYDTLSLQSSGSSTHILHKSGSTNSLPTPDPRYVRGHLHKLMGGAKRRTPPPSVGSRPLSTSLSMGISNIGAGAGRISPHQAQ